MPILGIIASSAKLPTAFDSIATATPAGTSSFTFSSIPQTYKSLQIRAILKDTYATTVANAQNISSGFFSSIQINGVTGNSASHQLLGNASTVQGYGTTSASYGSIGGWFANANATSIFGVGIIDIIDYTSTSKNKTLRYFTGVNANTTDTSYGLSLGSVLLVNTSAITSITIFAPGSQYATGTQFALYGIK